MTRGSIAGKRRVGRQPGTPDRNTDLKRPALAAAAANPAISPGMLRGGRYLRPANEWIAKFIIEELRFLDYHETASWYEANIPRRRAPRSWQARERHWPPGGSRCRLPRGAHREDPRARAARLGQYAEQPR